MKRKTQMFSAVYEKKDINRKQINRLIGAQEKHNKSTMYCKLRLNVN